MSSTSKSFTSLDEAVAEIERLRSRVERLEGELEAIRSDSTRSGVDHPEPEARNESRRVEPGAEAAEDSEGNPLHALEQFAEQIEAVRQFWRESAKTGGPLRSPAAASRSPITDVLSATDDVANRHLDELRAAIQKLREQRAQASMELLQLTKLNPTRAANMPARAATPAVTDKVAPFTRVVPLPDVREAGEPSGMAGDRVAPEMVRPTIREIADAATREIEAAVERGAQAEGDVAGSIDGAWPLNGLGTDAAPDLDAAGPDARPAGLPVAEPAVLTDAAPEALSTLARDDNDQPGAPGEPIEETPAPTAGDVSPEALAPSPGESPDSYIGLETLASRDDEQALIERKLDADEPVFISEASAALASAELVVEKAREASRAAASEVVQQRPESEVAVAADVIRPAGMPSRRPVALVAAAAGMLALAGIWWWTSSTPVSRTLADIDPPPVAAPPPVTAAPDAAATAAPDSAASLPPVATAPVPPAEGRHRLQFVIERDVWLQVTVDGTRAIREVVSAGQTLAFDVERDLVVRAGDAGAVRVVVDGDLRGPLGADGAVLTRAFEFPPQSR